jgi:hypothetical protein
MPPPTTHPATTNQDDQRAFNLVLKYGMHLTWNKNPFLRSSFREVIVGSIMKPPMQVLTTIGRVERKTARLDVGKG